MSHILQLMLWGRYAAEGGVEHHGDQHYSTTIDIYTHVTETKFEEEIAKFGSVSEKQKVQKNKNSTQCA